MVTAQKNMARMNNHQPTLQKLQIEAQLAGMRENKDQSRFAAQALDAYQNKHNLHPIKNLLPLWVNGLFMTSMFFGLRGMTNAPVESMTTGGTAWFTDLVATDPIFILPLTASGTIALMMYLGADGMNLDTIPPIMKKVGSHLLFYCESLLLGLCSLNIVDSAFLRCGFQTTRGE